MASKSIRNQKINRLKSLSNNLDEERLNSLNTGSTITNNVESMDLTYSSYAFSPTTEMPAIKEEENEDVDSLVEYIKNVDAAFESKPKEKKPSIAEKIIEENKNNPKLKRKEMLYTYDSVEEFTLDTMEEKAAIDFYLKALEYVQTTND